MSFRLTQGIPAVIAHRDHDGATPIRYTAHPDDQQHTQTLPPPINGANVKTQKKTVQIVLDDQDPADARILAQIARARELCPDLAGKTDSDVVNEALRVFVERKRRESGLAALHPGELDRDDIDPDDPDTGGNVEPRGGGPVYLWLDDLRPAPEGWTHVYTAPAAIAVLSTGAVQEISLDHDLGPDEGAGTGYDVATWIEAGAAEGTLARLGWAIHSANPVGSARRRAALESAERLWARGEAPG